MSRLRRVAAALLPVLLALGCTRVAVGAVRPAQNLTPKPLAGQALTEVLPDGVELSEVFGQSFETRSGFQARFGTVEELPDVAGSPTDCVGASDVMPKNAYRDTDVDVVATHLWWNSTPLDLDPTVISVDLGAASLPTAADANALFDEFTGRWQGCDGTTLMAADSEFSSTISGVRVENSVLSAAVRVNGPSSVIDHAHALGVRVNCLVEVEVAFFRQQLRAGESSAADIAHQMMDKVSRLT